MEECAKSTRFEHVMYSVGHFEIRGSLKSKNVETGFLGRQ